MKSLIPLCALALVAAAVLAGCDRSAPDGSPAAVTLIPPASATGGAISAPGTPAPTLVGQALTPLPSSAATRLPGSAPTPLPQATPAPPSGAPGQAETFPYIVQVGDTLQSVAAKFNTTVEVLRALNNLSTDKITVGQQLLIAGTPPSEQNQPSAKPTPSAQPSAPSGSVRTVRYVVKAGDRLYRIGLRFGVPWTTIARFNGIANPKSIQPGDVLFIPLP